MGEKVIYMLTTVFYPSIGGRESHIHNISKELIRLGYSVKIIHPVLNLEENHLYYLDDIEVHGVNLGDAASKAKYENYKKRSKGLAGYISGYLRKNYYNYFYRQVTSYIEQDIKKSNYHNKNVMIHQHDFISGYKVSKELSKNYSQIFTNHTGEFLFLKKLPFNKYIIRQLTKHFDYIISPSEELNQFKGIRDERTFCYMPNGVDSDRFTPVTEAEAKMLREKYHLDDCKTAILCPRRWAPTKGIIYLVKAAAILVHEYKFKDFEIIFAGNAYEDYPEYTNEIMTFIKDNKLESYVRLMGNLPYETMSEMTKVSDIVVIPSLMEAVSLSMLESMACGKIVIGSNTGGIPEVIRDGANGFLAEKGSAKALAHKLKYILENAKSLDYVKENAISTVQTKYTWTGIANRLNAIYIDVWSKKYE